MDLKKVPVLACSAVLAAAVARKFFTSHQTKVKPRDSSVRAGAALTRSDVGHMTAEEFRQAGHRLIDEIADFYATGIEQAPVLSQVKPGYLHDALPKNAPESAESFDAIMKDVHKLILPGVTHWQSPSFFGYFPANTSFPSILGDMLSLAWNPISFSWMTSPAATELETIVLDWFGRAMQLPDKFLSSSKGVGVIQGTASEATLVAMIAARMRAVEQYAKQHPEIRDPDAAASFVTSRLVAFASDQAHSSVKKAAMILGLEHRFRPVPSRADYTIDVNALDSMIAAAKKDGLIPFFVCATWGTTSSAAVDDLTAIGKITARESIYFHVDAAYAGSGWICPETRALVGDGLQNVNSLALNPHKALLVGFPCNLMWVDDRTLLYRTLSITPEYLRNKMHESGQVIDYRDLQIPLGRSFRSLKLWFVVRSYGLEGLRKHWRFHSQLAEKIERWIRADSDGESDIVEAKTSATTTTATEAKQGRWEVFGRGFSVVTFRLRVPVAKGLLPSSPEAVEQQNAVNQKLLDAVNNSGKAFFVSTKLNVGEAKGVLVLRFVTGAFLTDEKHARKAWQLFRSVADSLV